MLPEKNCVNFVGRTDGADVARFAMLPLFVGRTDGADVARFAMLPLFVGLTDGACAYSGVVLALARR